MFVRKVGSSEPQSNSGHSAAYDGGNWAPIRYGGSPNGHVLLPNDPISATNSSPGFDFENVLFARNQIRDSTIPITGREVRRLWRTVMVVSLEVLNDETRDDTIGLCNENDFTNKIHGTKQTIDPPFLPILGRSHVKVIFEGWTSKGSKAVKDPGTDSFVLKLADIWEDFFWMVVGVPETVEMENV